jgi:hypothetical protein
VLHHLRFPCMSWVRRTAFGMKPASKGRKRSTACRLMHVHCFVHDVARGTRGVLRTTDRRSHPNTK